jgi:hypothetical protein
MMMRNGMMRRRWLHKLYLFIFRYTQGALSQFSDVELFYNGRNFFYLVMFSGMPVATWNFHYNVSVPSLQI